MPEFYGSVSFHFHFYRQCMHEYRRGQLDSWINCVCCARAMVKRLKFVVPSWIVFLLKPNNTQNEIKLIQRHISSFQGQSVWNYEGLQYHLLTKSDEILTTSFRVMGYESIHMLTGHVGAIARRTYVCCPRGHICWSPQNQSISRGHHCDVIRLGMHCDVLKMTSPAFFWLATILRVRKNQPVCWI